jgi:predicted permease
MKEAWRAERRRFIWKHGVLQFGLPLSIFVSLVQFWRDPGGGAGYTMLAADVFGLLLGIVAGALVGGFLFGFLFWHLFPHRHR